MTKSNLKSLLILVVTLVIGIAIGFEVSEISIKKRFDEMHSLRKPAGFINMFDGIIKPDAGQKAEIDTILFRYHEKIELITHSGMDSVSKVIDSMKVALSSKLTKEQMARLDAEYQRIKRGPPPPMPPPEH